MFAIFGINISLTAVTLELVTGELPNVNVPINIFIYFIIVKKYWYITISRGFSISNTLLLVLALVLS